MRHSRHTGRAIALLALAALSTGCTGPTDPDASRGGAAASPSTELRSLSASVTGTRGAPPETDTRSLTASGDCAWDDVTAALYACSAATGSASAFAACAVVVWQSFCEAMSFYDFLDEVSTPDGPFGGGGGGAW